MRHWKNRWIQTPQRILMDPCIKQAPVLSKRFWIIPWPLAYNRFELDCIRKIINFWYTFGWKWRVFVTIYDCRTHVRMTSMTSSVERTDLNFKISVALLSTFDWIIPLFRLWHWTHKGPCEQNIWSTPWARIMIFCMLHADCILRENDLINFGQNYLHNWLDYLPFPTLVFCVVKQPCEQNILRTTWTRIMISGVQFGYIM